MNSKDNSIIIKNEKNEIPLKNDFNKINIINEELLETINKMTTFNLNLSNKIIDEYINNQSKIKDMVSPLIKATNDLLDVYTPAINSAIKSITKLLKDIDWSKYDLIYKEISLKYLKNGFYIYQNSCISYEELLKANNESLERKIIKNAIKKDIKSRKKDILLIYPQYKKIINEIYRLYNNHYYRLCVLSLINLISIINNDQYEYIDFTERQEIRKKLIEKNIMKEKEKNYILFSPYIEDKDLKNQNYITNGYKHNKEKYIDLPYNRNAILHGYSKRFGTEINCLRWFSVLLNTTEISIKIVEFESIKQ